MATSAKAYVSVAKRFVSLRILSTGQCGCPTGVIPVRAASKNREVAEIFGMREMEAETGQEARITIAAEIFDVNNPGIHMKPPSSGTR